MISTPRRPTKRSEHQWLGDIPTDWLVVDLKYLTRFINGAAFAPTDWGDEGVPIIRIVNLNGGDEFNYTKREVDPRYIVRTNDLLFGWSGNRGTSFGPFIWRREGVHLLNQHIFRLEGYDLDKAFFYWLLKAVTAHVESQVSGIIGLVHITKEDLGNIAVPVPSPSEQRAIAAFLDRKTAEIDAVIARKERLIALLQEERQALISRAVTRGLDAGAAMKDSGIPGLDQIPNQWVELSLRHLLQGGPKNGISPPPAENGEGVPSFSIAAVRSGRIKVSDHVKFVSLDVESATPYRLNRGDVLVMRGNANLDLVGTCGIVDDFPDGCTYPDILIRLTPTSRILREFLVAAINSRYCRQQIETAAKTSNGTYKISGEDVSELRIALPPCDEQHAICSSIDRATNRIDSLIRMNSDQITKLREYRQALISGAVTGKLALPQEVSS